MCKVHNTFDCLGAFVSNGLKHNLKDDKVSEVKDNELETYITNKYSENELKKKSYMKNISK